MGRVDKVCLDFFNGLEGPQDWYLSGTRAMSSAQGLGEHS
jgi:hypothetical protein